MRQFVRRILRSLGFFKGNEDSQVLVPKEIMEELAKPPLDNPGYIPYLDEPSVFDMNPNKTNVLWIHWAQGRYHLPLSHAAEMADRHKRWLQSLLPRKVNTAVVPDILINFTYRGVACHALSLEWVIWYANAYGMSLQDAHEEGVFLTTRQPQGIA